MGKKQKPKKKKTVYVDDGRTIADMSAVGRGKRGGSYYGQELKGGGNPLSTSFRERAKTYFAAVRMMFLPMLAFMGIICLLFLVLWLVFGVLA